MDRFKRAVAIERIRAEAPEIDSKELRDLVHNLLYTADLEFSECVRISHILPKYAYPYLTEATLTQFFSYYPSGGK